MNKEKFKEFLSGFEAPTGIRSASYGDDDGVEYPSLKEYFLKGQCLRDPWFWIVPAILVLIGLVP